MKQNNNRGGATLISYIVGFSSSLVLTLAAYDLVRIHISSEHSMVSHEVLIPAILALAVLQLIIQLIFFLHLNFGRSGSSDDRWKMGIFISTIAFVLLIVFASLWIMNHLNYNMTPAQVNQYMQDQQGGF